MTNEPSTTPSPTEMFLAIQAKLLPKSEQKSPADPELPAMPLIPVTEGAIGDVPCQLVDGRTLHLTLGVSRDFTTWMKGKIKDYEFVEGVDYLLTKSGGRVFTKSGENLIEDKSDNKVYAKSGENHGDRPSSDYTLTLNMAKEIAMVEQSDLGRQVRRYFIQCEQQLIQATQQKLRDLEEDQRAYPCIGLDGKPIEDQPLSMHFAIGINMIHEKARRGAYREYARTLAILGAENEAMAVKMADANYRECFFEKFDKVVALQDEEKFMDLREIRKVITDDTK